MSNWVILHDPYHIGTVASWMTGNSTPPSPPISAITHVNFTLTFSGIGTNISVGLNNNPLHPIRPVIVQIRNANNNTIQSITTILRIVRLQGPIVDQ